MIKIIQDIINIRRNLVVENPIPLSIAINITGRCNLRCEFCEKSHNISKDEIDFQGVKKLIDFGLRYNCSIFIGGGELKPLFQKYSKKYVAKKLIK